MHAHEEPGKSAKGASPRRLPAVTPGAVAPPATLASGASAVLALQRLAGNAAVSRALTGQGQQGQRQGRQAPLPVQRSGREPGPGRGTYGYRSHEAALLEEEYGDPISGRTHQHEHTVLFNVGARGSGMQRGATGPAGQPIRVVYF